MKYLFMLFFVTVTACAKPCYECTPFGDYPIEICGDKATTYIGADNYASFYVDPIKYMNMLKTNGYTCLEVE